MTDGRGRDRRTETELRGSQPATTPVTDIWSEAGVCCAGPIGKTVHDEATTDSGKRKHVS
ncbi:MULTISPECIES: hypothetical protein [unclassified Nocardioides]|uniref:hypothetical protein n=1 Tax=unclassified Nocardioides TaxID=2615069 RepID=UPI0002DD6C94|nr:MULTISPECIES: hypothetical protein [unclassified Nocardioides]